MSLPSRITLGVSCAATAGTIFFVHYQQHSDRSKLHEGVLKDIERQKMRKVENRHELIRQQDLTKFLKQDLEKKEQINRESQETT